MAKRQPYLERRALRLLQNPEHPLYLFSLTGKELLEIAEISRVSRDQTGKLIGYQRPEVRRHVEDIVEYLNSDGVVFPNSIILALSTKVRFLSSRGPKTTDGLARAGTLRIPVPGPSDPRPAWIVDGQQRALAISKANRSHLPIPISAFLADDVATQRDQFLRINNTKPLPRGLITELLPEVSAPLPARLAARRIPSALCDLLSRDRKSPFFGLIRHASTPKDDRTKAVISDSSVVKMIEESIGSPSGCLFPYRNVATGETDFDAVMRLLVAYWLAVRETFPEAWGKPPTTSRLTHGAGIRAMGRLMDRVMSPVQPHDKGLLDYVKRELKIVEPHCAWTKGKWSGLGDLRWNEIQNVPRHVAMLSNHLVRIYVQARTGAA